MNSITESSANHVHVNFHKGHNHQPLSTVREITGCSVRLKEISLGLLGTTNRGYVDLLGAQINNAGLVYTFQQRPKGLSPRVVVVWRFYCTS